MKYAIVKRNPSGTAIVKVEFRELTATQAENLSEIAAVVSMTPSMGGKSTVYIDRVARQAVVNYDELYELARRNVQHSERGGWIS